MPRVTVTPPDALVFRGRVSRASGSSDAGASNMILEVGIVLGSPEGPSQVTLDVDVLINEKDATKRWAAAHLTVIRRSDGSNAGWTWWRPRSGSVVIEETCEATDKGSRRIELELGVSILNGRGEGT